MNKLLVICGPTATGKTSLGVRSAQKYDGEIVSADSRQVYRGMDIITGKDLGKNSEFRIKNSEFNLENNKLSVGFREKEGIPIWLVDIVDPTYIFNVGEYVKIAKQVIENIWSRNKLPIVVGGSGLYINSLTKPPSHILIPPNKKLRKQLEKLSVSELGAYLARTDPGHWQGMNQSDRLNPRRLIRAIEISRHREKKTPPKNYFFEKAEQDALYVGLKTNLQKLYVLIDRRVQERINQGAIEEAKQLLRNGYPSDLPAFTATGYRPLLKLVEKVISLEAAILDWRRAENNYVRDQLRWFGRDRRIHWFDIEDQNYLKQIESSVGKWYTLGKPGT